MFYKVMHYISKYSLMLLIYSLVVALAFKVFGISTNFNNSDLYFFNY